MFSKKYHGEICTHTHTHTYVVYCACSHITILIYIHIYIYTNLSEGFYYDLLIYLYAYLLY
jgi:hypothetical protein